MDIYKKLGIIFAVALAFLIFAGFYDSSPLTEKVIVLSVGIDLPESGEGFDVSYEVAQASLKAQGDSAGGSDGGNVIKGSGPTLSTALQDASEKAGKLVSLGQSSVIVIGEDYCRKANVAQVLSYFSLSDAFRDGTSVIACRGKAADLLSVKLPLGGYVGLVLENTVQHDGKKLGIPYVNVVDFTKMQLSEKQSSYLPLAEFVREPQSASGQPQTNGKPVGRFEIRKTMLFGGGRFLFEADKEFTENLVFMTESESFRTYVINDPLSNPAFTKKAAVGITEKKLSFGCRTENDRAVLEVSVRLKVKRLRTDTDGNVSFFTAKSYGEISQLNKIEVQNKVKADVEGFYALLRKYDCDVTGLWQTFYKKLGSEWTEFTATRSDWLEKMKTEVYVDVSN